MQYKLCRTELPGSYGDFVLWILGVLRVRILRRLYICKRRIIRVMISKSNYLAG